MQQSSGIVLNSLRDILYVVFRHKFAVFFVFLLTVVAVTFVTFALPQVYESDASVLVRIGRENLPGDPQVAQAMVNVNQDRTAEVRSEIAIVKSVEIAQKVAEELGPAWMLGKKSLGGGPKPIAELGEWPADNIIKSLAGTAIETAKEVLILLQLRVRLTPEQEAVQKVQDGLMVEVEKQTNNINISFEHKNPKVAQFVLSRLMTYYFAKHVEVFSAQTHPEFFKDEAARFGAQLEETEQAISDFRTANNISQIDTQIEVLIGRIADLEGNIETTAAETKGLEALVDNLNKSLSSRPKMHEVAKTSGMVNFAADTIKEKLIELRAEEKDLANRFQDGYRPLEDVRLKIQDLEGQLTTEKEYRTETTVQLDRNFEGLEHTALNEASQIAARYARHEALTAELEKLKGELALLNSQQVQLSKLSRDRDIAEKEYKEYREHLQRSNIAVAMDASSISNVSEVQPASAPLDPIRPKKARNIGLGILLGIFLGLAYAFLLEFLDDSLNTVESVEKRLGVPVLAALSVNEYKSCT